MTPCKEDVEQFKQLYLQEFGVELPYDEAARQAQALVRLLELQLEIYEVGEAQPTLPSEDCDDRNVSSL